jgi:hypothetical protein
MFNVTLSNYLVESMRTKGAGFTSRTWINSECMAYLEKLDDGITIYSNGSDAIMFWLNKDALPIPAKIFPGTRLPNENFDKDFALIQTNVDKGDAIVVFFTELSVRWYLPSKSEFGNTYKLPILHLLRDGIIYGYDESN